MNPPDTIPAERGSAFSTVSRVSPTQQVQNQLFAAIESGEYEPGGKLPSERVLCDTFGVSRVSVREALAGLAATGLIEVRQGKGAFVRPRVVDGYVGPFGKYIATHRHELAELLFVRGALDGVAASSAAGQLTPETREAMQRAHDAFGHAVATGASPVELSELDVAFHQQIAAAARGTLLHKLLGELNSLLVESRHILFAREGQPQRSFADHTEILQAILDGDLESAERRSREHASKMQDWVEQFAIAGDSN
ncbi:FadR family transcriptional regulator [Leucobacter zeae]|nr:FadR family transcriptional regulator [Leucobacter zeae]